MPLVADAAIYADLHLAHGDEPLGTVTILLEHERAPRPVANFIGLATGQFAFIDPVTEIPKEGVRYYDDTVFHRLIHNFVLQGGDRTGSGAGGPGYVFQDQFHPELRHDGPYKISMAHAGPHTNGSQFFITLAETAFLDNNHSVFGEVVGGRDIIDRMRDNAQFPTGSGDRPTTPIRLVQVEIRGLEESGFDIHAADIGLPRLIPVELGMEVSAVLDVPENEQNFDVLAIWNRRRFIDYQVFVSPNINDWYRLGYALSVDDEDFYGIPVNGYLGNSSPPSANFIV
ncbi:MAG: peptidylprolyl isomerase [Verrucomicrobia bacterium]|nr:peptidylprolyl isomerase [Verrucomicrobiota bacterium]